MNRTKIVLLCLMVSIATHAQKPIILWDIHDVLMQSQDRPVTIFTFPYYKELFSHLSWPLIKDLLFVMAKNVFQDASSEEYIHTAMQHGNPHLAEFIIAVGNSQSPITGMKELVDELYELGLEQHIGSNIGRTSFHRLLDPRKYPYIAPLFKHMNLNRSMVVSLHKGKSIKKPDPRFFERYLLKNKINLAMMPIIFIDDRWDNVRVARSMGFDAILFKNPQQLRLALRKRNIPVKAPCFTYSSQRDSHILRPRSLFVQPIPSQEQPTITRPTQIIS